MVPFFEWDDVEHIAPSFDEPRSSSGDSSLTDLWEEADVKEEKLAIKKGFSYLFRYERLLSTGRRKKTYWKEQISY
jgi:hypothetical protein